MAKTGRNCKIYMDLAGPKIRIKSIHALKKNEDLELPVKEGTELILSHSKAAEIKGKKHKRKADILHIEPKELLGMVKELSLIHI